MKPSKKANSSVLPGSNHSADLRLHTGDYQQFCERVEGRYPAVVGDEKTCIIFDLRDSS
jgi:hypothetical protein